MNRIYSLSLALTAALSSGCSADVLGNEGLASQESEIGESSCGTARADFVLRLSINRNQPVLTPPGASGVASPTTYDNPACDKAYVIDLVNSALDDIKANIPMEVVYNGPRITRLGQITNEINADEATCKSIRMRAIRYEQVIGANFRLQPHVIDDVTTAASFIPTSDPPPFPNQPRQGICFAPASIPLSPTPASLLTQKLAIQVVKSGGTTISVKLQARK